MLRSLISKKDPKLFNAIKHFQDEPNLNTFIEELELISGKNLRVNSPTSVSKYTKRYYKSTTKNSTYNNKSASPTSNRVNALLKKNIIPTKRII